MTNTRITDPEILERRYPVVLREFRCALACVSLGYTASALTRVHAPAAACVPAAAAAALSEAATAWCEKWRFVLLLPQRRFAILVPDNAQPHSCLYLSSCGR